jgi:hypothetical protein
MANSPLELHRIQDQYMESFNFLQIWKRRKVSQLVLLNNLQRGDQNIASTLLLTLFNRVLSNLYDDKLQVKFLPSQGIEQEQLNSYNTLAQSDYLEMDKPKLDYDWCWDALFFNRGYMETNKFNKKRKIMEPHIINPLVFGYDPYFTEPQEWRYYWKWITKSKHEVQRLIDNGTITGIEKPEDIPSGVDAYLWNYKSLRDAAKKAVAPPTDSMQGDIYQILEFYGYNNDGKKVCRWVDKDFTKIVYEEVLDFEDLDYGDQDKKDSKWPIVVKEAFREPHASINFGIADLLEDKHRAKSVLLNLAFIAAKDKANPLYWYNDNVTDVTALFSRQINQHIKLNDQAIGDSSIGPINTQEPMTPELLQFVSMLQQEANEPLGTGVTLQPQKNKSSNTATEAAIDQQLNDMAQSLQSKVMQFGESEFWSHWFHRYAKYSDELGDKMANIVGVKGITSQMINLKDFHTDYPPGVMVYSAKEAEYKELVLRRDLMQLYPELVQTLDADGMRNFNKHVFFPKFLQDPSLIDIMLPKTLDELKAETENEQIIRNEMPDVLPTDNHTTHIYTHNMIPPGKRTWAMWFHIEAHQQALAQQKAQEQMMQQQQMAKEAGVLDKPGAKTGTINVGAEKRSPQAATSPLKTAMNPSDNLINNNQQ